MDLEKLFWLHKENRASVAKETRENKMKKVTFDTLMERMRMVVGANWGKGDAESGGKRMGLGRQQERKIGVGALQSFRSSGGGWLKDSVTMEGAIQLIN